MEEKKASFKKGSLIAIAAAAVVIVALAAVVILSATRKKGTESALVVRILRTEGDVTLYNEKDEKITILDNMRLNGGFRIVTAGESEAQLLLDDTKVVTLMESSELKLEKKGKALTLQADKGSLYVNVREKLADGERFEIETSTMVVGIRGTSLYADADKSELLMTDGTSEVTAKDPETGKRLAQTRQVNGGEKLELSVYRENKETKAKFAVTKITPDDLSEAVLRAIGRDSDKAGLIGRIIKSTGWSRETLETKIQESVDSGEGKEVLPEESGAPASQEQKDSGSASAGTSESSRSESTEQSTAQSTEQSSAPAENAPAENVAVRPSGTREPEENTTPSAVAREAENTGEPENSQESESREESGSSQESESREESGSSQESESREESGSSQESESREESGSSQESESREESGSSQESESREESGSSQESESREESGSSQESGGSQGSGDFPQYDPNKKVPLGKAESNSTIKVSDVTLYLTRSGEDYYLSGVQNSTAGALRCYPDEEGTVFLIARKAEDGRVNTIGDRTTEYKWFAEQGSEGTVSRYYFVTLEAAKTVYLYYTDEKIVGTLEKPENTEFQEVMGVLGSGINLNAADQKITIQDRDYPLEELEQEAGSSLVKFAVGSENGAKLTIYYDQTEQAAYSKVRRALNGRNLSIGSIECRNEYRSTYALLKAERFIEPEEDLFYLHYEKDQWDGEWKVSAGLSEPKTKAHISGSVSGSDLWVMDDSEVTFDLKTEDDVVSIGSSAQNNYLELAVENDGYYDEYYANLTFNANGVVEAIGGRYVDGTAYFRYYFSDNPVMNARAIKAYYVKLSDTSGEDVYFYVFDNEQYGELELIATKDAPSYTALVYVGMISGAGAGPEENRVYDMSGDSYVEIQDIDTNPYLVTAGGGHIPVTIYDVDGMKYVYTSLEKTGDNAYQIGGVECTREEGSSGIVYYVSLPSHGEIPGTLYLIQGADEDGSVNTWECWKWQSLNSDLGSQP